MASKTKQMSRLAGAVAALASATMILAACTAGPGDGGGDGEKDKVFLNLSYSGNNWQDEAANLAMAIAKAPGNAEKYDVTKQISGTDVQKQISDLQSMIASGAKFIVSYPISPTALDQVVQEGCDRGVTFVFYDSTVNAECAYNVAFITGALADEPERAFFGAQTAQALVDLLEGEGKIFLNRGVAGTSTDAVHFDTAMAVFNKYPGIEIVAEFYGSWDSSQSQQETAKALAAHPDVEGVWSQDGEAGVVKALEAAGLEIPVTGENSNYFRQRLSEGWPGVSSGSLPAQAGIAMKVGLHILENGVDGIPKNIEVPLPWVTTETAKPCEGTEFVDGCNFFPGQADTFVTEVFQADLLPEASLDTAKTGTGITEVQDLPDMSKFAQPEWRRIYTRGACDEGWAEGSVTENQIPAGLPGCVQQ